MAFMMPVMKNEFDIYNGSRTRKVSECSNASATTGQRSRKVSECKSESQSFSTSPGNGFEYMSPHHRMQMNRSQSTRAAFPRNSSRTSQSSNAFAVSPTRAYSQAASPPKTQAGSQISLNKFHNRLVDKLPSTTTVAIVLPPTEQSVETSSSIVQSTRALRIQTDSDNDEKATKPQQQHQQQQQQQNQEQQQQQQYLRVGRFATMRQRITAPLLRRNSTKRCRRCRSAIDADCRSCHVRPSSIVVASGGELEFVENVSSTSAATTDLYSSSEASSMAGCDNHSTADQSQLLSKSKQRRPFFRRRRRSTSRYSSCSAPG